jgi:hypothetical protein
MLKKKVIAIAVISTMENGYRRAGFALEKGINNLEVFEEQYDLLDVDPRLTITVKETVEATVDVAKPSEKQSKTNEAS